MADYIWTESAGTTCELVPRVIDVQLGDGYVQSADDGLNPLQQMWDIVHTDVEEVLVDEIEAFVKPGMGRVAFDWVPLGETVAIKVRCKSYRKVQTERWGFWNLSLRFEQWFGP